VVIFIRGHEISTQEKLFIRQSKMKIVVDCLMYVIFGFGYFSMAAQGSANNSTSPP